MRVWACVLIAALVVVSWADESPPQKEEAATPPLAHDWFKEAQRQKKVMEALCMTEIDTWTARVIGAMNESKSRGGMSIIMSHGLSLMRCGGSSGFDMFDLFVQKLSSPPTSFRVECHTKAYTSRVKKIWAEDPRKPAPDLQVRVWLREDGDYRASECTSPKELFADYVFDHEAAAIDEDDDEDVAPTPPRRKRRASAV